MVNPFNRGKKQSGDNTTSRLAQSVLVKRQPTTSDTHDPRTGKPFVKGSFWCVDQSPVTGTEGDLWYLKDNTVTVATWIMLAPGSGGSSGPLLTVRDQVNATAVPDGSGNFDFDGAVVASGANPSGIPVETVVGTNAITHQTQVAKARTGAPGNKNDAGLCSFDDTAFNVDADGYVTLSGGPGPAVDSIDVDFNTAPGTDPVVPTASGVIQIYGNSVSNGTNANAPVATHSRAANQLHVDVQLATAITGAPADPYDVGLASFDDTIFTVDGNGYASFAGTTAGDVPVYNGTAWEFSSASTDAVQLPDGTTAQRPGSPSDGMIRYNQDEECVEAYINGAWQCLASGGGGPGSYTETQILAASLLFDDFIASNPGVNNYGPFAFTFTGESANDTNTEEAAHPGHLRLFQGAASVSSAISARTTDDGAAYVVGAGVLRCVWIVKIPTLSTATERFKVWIGLSAFSNAGGTGDPDDGIFFTYSDNENSGNWIINTRASSTSSTGNTSNAADTNWVKLAIEVNAAGTSVKFEIDDVEVANSPLTTNIPSIGIAPYLNLYKSVHTATTVDILADLVVVDYQLTTSR